MGYRTWIVLPEFINNDLFKGELLSREDNSMSSAAYEAGLTLIKDGINENLLRKHAIRSSDNDNDEE